MKGQQQHADDDRPDCGENRPESGTNNTAFGQIPTKKNDGIKPQAVGKGNDVGCDGPSDMVAPQDMVQMIPKAEDCCQGNEVA